jgi:hypothetical protein
MFPFAALTWLLDRSRPVPTEAIELISIVALALYHFYFDSSVAHCRDNKYHERDDISLQCQVPKATEFEIDRYFH